MNIPFEVDFVIYTHAFLSALLSDAMSLHFEERSLYPMPNPNAASLHIGATSRHLVVFLHAFRLIQVGYILLRMGYLLHFFVYYIRNMGGKKEIER